MATPSSFHLGGAALALALGFGLAAPAQAQTAARDTPSSTLRAPTADEAAALAARPSGKGSAPRGLLTGKANPQPVIHRDGTIEQELDDSTMMYSVARRNANGSISTYCVPGAQNADRLVKGTTAVAKTAKGHSHEHK